MRTLATILDNPGEPPAETRYRNPIVLKELGYDTLVIYHTTGLSGLLGPDTVANPDIRRWVTEQYDQLDQTIEQATAAGLKVWLVYDTPTIARELVGSAMLCERQTSVLCPASNELLDMSGQCLDAMLARYPDIEAVVLRQGDNDAHRVPFLMGNDIYSPHCARCSSLGRADRLAKSIRFYHDLVVKKLGRKLVVRAWNAKPGGLHDSPDLCQRVIEKLPEDNENLILSFKFTHTDFWRYQQWNPSSLVCGDRPVIYELECQREFEGKGALPNYQPPLWRNGMPELGSGFGLTEAVKQVNLVGLWAWVRGGGYGGPYVSPQSETWIDANVAAVPTLAADPAVSVHDLAHRWITQQMGCRDSAAIEALYQVLANSTENALQAFYIGPYARHRNEPWYPSGNFIQDDLIDAEAGHAIIQRMSDAAMDEALSEKQSAVERLAGDRRALQLAASHIPNSSGQTLIHQMEYAESLAETLRHLLAAMTASRRAQRRGGDVHQRNVIEAVHQCQNYWNHHQRFANFRGTATAFRSDNLWDFTQRLIDAVHA